MTLIFDPRLRYDKQRTFSYGESWRPNTSKATACVSVPDALVVHPGCKLNLQNEQKMAAKTLMPH